jgi:hypothetical protein
VLIPKNPLVVEESAMREKLILAATLTFSLYLFVEVSMSVKISQNHLRQSPQILILTL